MSLWASCTFGAIRADTRALRPERKHAPTAKPRYPRSPRSSYNTAARHDAPPPGEARSAADGNRCMETARHDLLEFGHGAGCFPFLRRSNLRRHPRWAAPNKHGGLTRAPQTRACLATPREDGAQAAGCTDASGSTPASVDRPVFDLNKVYTKWLRAWCAGRNGDQHRGLGLGNPRARNTGARLRRHASPRLDGCTFYMHSRECARSCKAQPANLITTPTCPLPLRTRALACPGHRG